jgi:RimJ/RimL family protein N-acetyltransferase
MIYGERIRFRAPEREDLPLFKDWINDPEVRQGISMYAPMSMAREEEWFEEMLKRPPDEMPFTIETEVDGAWKAIGNCGFFNLDWRTRSTEFGIMIGEKAHWNKGYGTEAVGLLLRHGFDTLNLNRITLKVYASNKRAIRTYEKAGFVKEGVMREEQFYDGEYIDVIFMSVLRSEWKSKG